MFEKSAADNLVGHVGKVRPADRGKLLSQRGCVIWLTGLSGAGKSTIAYELEQRLVQGGHLAFVLDGDNVRKKLNADLGFSPEDRDENIRRIGELSALFADAGIITIAAFISPYRAGRAKARQAVGEERFVEVFLDIPIENCEKRDPKGLYRKARDGEISDFTGIDAPYEPPVSPEIILKTASATIDECVTIIEKYLQDRNFLSE